MEEASPGIIMNEQASLLHMLICFGKYGVEYCFIDLKRKRWHLLHCLLHVIHAAKKIKRETVKLQKYKKNNKDKCEGVFFFLSVKIKDSTRRFTTLTHLV